MGKRARAMLLAGLLLAGACSTGSSDDSVVGSRGATGTTSAAGGSPTEAAAGATSTVPAGDTHTTASVGGPSNGSTPIPAPGAGPGPAGGSPPIPSLPVGQLAPYLLGPGNGDRIVVELRAQSGAEPTAATMDHLVRLLRDASGKEVLVDGPDALGGTGQAWTAGSLNALADRSAQLPQGGRQVVLRLLFLQGTFEGDSGVLGVAVRGDVAAVFSDQVAAAAGLLVASAVVEDAVSVHELGHLLGLVDLVLGTGRGDPEHPGHSRNRRSVMYWAVESDAISQLLGGGIPNEFDTDDRADLATIRRG